MAGEFTDKDILDYIWNYFQLHSKQRISVFNFYVSFSSLITIPLILSIEKGQSFGILGLILGFLLFILSFVFYRLDQRTRMLIKHSEDALKDLENNFYPEYKEKVHKTRIFQLEEICSNFKREKESFPSNLLFSYTNCFNLVFLIFGVIGILFMIYYSYQLIINPGLIWQSNTSTNNASIDLFIWLFK